MGLIETKADDSERNLVSGNLTMSSISILSRGIASSVVRKLCPPNSYLQITPNPSQQGVISR